MFKDYYAILEVGENATQEEIKSAFKKQALKWHPDKNPGVDTTQRMQEINEAYLILKDTEARERYYIEYQRFKQYQRQKAQASEDRQKQREYEQQRQSQQKEKKHYEKTYEYADYNVNDDILKKWMNNAKRQAVELAKQTIEDLKGMVVAGTKAATKEAGGCFIFQIIISAIFLIIFVLAKSCHN
jgi:curved DNA-binding protein CbpA